MYQTRPSDVEQDKHIIPDTVITFLQTVLAGKTDYSQPLKRVEQLTNCRHWWQDQTTKTHHVSLCNQVSDWEYRSDAYHGSIGLWCFIHTNCRNLHGTVPSKAGRIRDGRGIAKKHLPGCTNHAASMGHYRPLGGDDQWRRHIAPGKWHGCAAHNHRTNVTT